MTPLSYASFSSPLIRLCLLNCLSEYPLRVKRLFDTLFSNLEPTTILRRRHGYLVAMYIKTTILERFQQDICDYLNGKYFVKEALPSLAGVPYIGHVAYRFARIMADEFIGHRLPVSISHKGHDLMECSSQTFLTSLEDASPSPLSTLMSSRLQITSS